MSIDTLGWTSSFENALRPYRDAGFIPARIAREDRERYQVLTAENELRAEITGRFRHQVRTRADFPAVGDWVALEIQPRSEFGLIHAVLPRRSIFSRKMTGPTTEEQVVAANIDTAFLVMDLGRDYNPRRIERYLTLTWESGAAPVILLTKTDVADDVDSAIAEIESIALGVPVHAICALQAKGLDQLEPYLTIGRTVALFGSSGAGKSTLINALLGEDRLLTRELKDDGRGKHATTWRELIQLPSGAVVVDTPGMKQVELWADESSLDESFDDVSLLATTCKFTDCSHSSEPGCAVQAALADGTLQLERFESYLKLQRELKYLHRKQDVRAMLEEKARWKRIHMSVRRQYKQR